MLSKNAPTNDRNNTFEAVMNILGNLGPDQQDLVFVVTQPLIQNFYVSFYCLYLYLYVYFYLKVASCEYVYNI